MARKRARFDPYGLLAALERQAVSYIVIGGFARVIHGTGELTRGLDIVPSTRPENLRRLSEAFAELGARADAREAAALTERLPTVLAVTTDRGLLQVVPAPLGTRGYDDLRRRATREPLGRGLRPSVAAPEDLARMLSALDRERDAPALHRIRRVMAFERQLGHGLEL